MGYRLGAMASLMSGPCGLHCATVVRLEASIAVSATVDEETIEKISRSKHFNNHQRDTAEGARLGIGLKANIASSGLWPGYAARPVSAWAEPSL
jgi:hypothetical protein